MSLKTEGQQASQVMNSDIGVGMNEEQINRLGSIHFSTRTNGTGLGLTFSYEVIRALGGEVSVKSAWGGHDVYAYDSRDQSRG